MGSPDAALRRRWERLCDELGTAGASLDGLEDLGAELIARYQEPHRHHHTGDHLLEVLEALDDLCDPEPVPASACLAAWFHDAVYDGRAGDDEEASARLAEARLAAVGLDRAQVDTVAAMVRATARHLDPSAHHDEVTALLLDADLSVLAADRDRYDAYAAGVRREHPTVPTDRFVAGRLAVLGSLLARPRLFLTVAGAARYEQRARENLARERAALIEQAADAPRP